MPATKPRHKASVVASGDRVFVYPEDVDVPVSATDRRDVEAYRMIPVWTALSAFGLSYKRLDGGVEMSFDPAEISAKQAELVVLCALASGGVAVVKSRLPRAALVRR